jgi:cation-transporting ATPase 13A1
LLRKFLFPAHLNFTDVICRRDQDVDLEGEFAPSLLNSAVYLLQLIQQISTFAINYQGRPFREALSENRSMYYGILAVTAIAFSCSTEFVPEINQRMRLVPFTKDFKTTLTFTMIVDYLGCFVIEKALKALFSDYKPKDIALRRPDQLAREQQRIDDAIAEVIRLEEEKAAKEIEELERKLREKGRA